MAKKQIMKCKNCGESSEVKKSWTLLGFPRWSCPKCKKEHISPLTSSYRNGYIALVTLGVLIFLYGVSTGRIFAPGLLLICALIALYKDGKMRKNLNTAGLAKVASPHVQSQVATAPSKDSTFCAQCGVNLDKGTKFCKGCGAKVEF